MNPMATREEHESVLGVARGHLYRFFSLACSDPRAARWRKLRDPGSRKIALAAWDYVRADPAARPEALAPGETRPDESAIKSIFDFRYEHFHLSEYDPHPGIRAPIAV